MADSPAVTDVEKMPTGGGGNVNEPSSGTYGEDAALASLQAELPPMAAESPEAGGTGAQAPPFMGAGGPPPGLPPSLLAPSNRPDVPVGTPLSAPTPPPVDDVQKRIMILQHLQSSPETSTGTKRWATLWLNRLIRADRQ